MEHTTASVLLQCSLWKTTVGFLSCNLLENMVFKLPMYDVQYLKANRFGNSLLFPFSGGWNNKYGDLYHQLFVLLEA